MERKILSEKVVWEFRAGHIFFQVILRTVVRQKSDGTYAEPFSFYVFHRGHSVSALIRNTQTDELLFVCQYRAGTDSYEYELPAGMLDENENPSEAVDREVMEETGYAYSSKVFLRHLKLSPGAYAEEADLFYLETNESLKLEAGGGRIQESEILEVVWIDTNMAIELMNSGLITDAKTVVALMWLQLRLANK